MLRSAALLVLLVAGSVSAQTSRLVVTVVDDSTAWALPGATVTVANGAGGATAGADGVAEVALAPGIYVVSVSAEGYSRATFTVTLDGGGASGTVGLVPAPVELAEVGVTAERPRRDLARTGFYDRRAEGRGAYIDREELDLKGAGQLAAAFIGVPGVRVQRWEVNGITRTILVSGRSGMGPNGFRDNSPCPMTIYKDDVQIGNDESFDVQNLGTEDLAGIEVYAGPATIPSQYRQFSACGVVLLWSRQE